MERYKVIVVGVSAGGLEALSVLLAPLRKDYPLPIIIVQHVLEGSDSFLTEYLNEKFVIEVKEAEDKETIRKSCVYIAPSSYHLMIEEDESFSLSVDPRVNYSRPSIDVLFESAAYVFEERCIGIILTGANSDGSNGLKMIKEKGGLTIVQDPKSAEYDIMPKAAISATSIDFILDLKKMATFLAEHISGGGVS